MRRDAGNTWRSDSRTGWWFGTLNIKHIDTHSHLVGGLEHVFFHNIWDVILPID